MARNELAELLGITPDPDGFDVVHHDSGDVGDIERQPGDELIIYDVRHGRRILVSEVTLEEWEAYKADHTRLKRLLKTHPCRYID